MTTLRARAVAMVALCALVIGTPSTRATEPTTATVAESQFVTLINNLRVAVGVRPLVVHAGLQVVARAWTVKMSLAGDFSHNPNLATQVTVPWGKLGENVGVGSAVEWLHEAFMASPEHYANLVDPVYDNIAVSVVLSGDDLYVTEQFMDLLDVPQPPAPKCPPNG